MFLFASLLLTSSLAFAPLTESAALDSPYRHVRTQDRLVRHLLKRGFRDSPTFAALMARLEHSDVLVYIEEVPRLPGALEGRMMMLPTAHGQRYVRIQITLRGAPDEAVALLKQITFAGFDESIEVHANLGIDPRQADQAVRSTVVLPHGTGKIVRVLVFAQGEAEKFATDAGADHVGSDDIVAKIQSGWLEFDAAVAMADMMGKVGGLGRILGRKGLMPNPRSGTVVRNPEDLAGVLRELKGGRVEFRNDRNGNIHSVIGRKSFTDDQVRENLYSFVDALNRAKPSGAKGVYIKSLSITTTMAPGISLNVSIATQNAAALSA